MFIKLADCVSYLFEFIFSSVFLCMQIIPLVFPSPSAASMALPYCVWVCVCVLGSCECFLLIRHTTCMDAYAERTTETTTEDKACVVWCFVYRVVFVAEVSFVARWLSCRFLRRCAPILCCWVQRWFNTNTHTLAEQEYQHIVRTAFMFWHWCMLYRICFSPAASAIVATVLYFSFESHNFYKISQWWGEKLYTV